MTPEKTALIQRHLLFYLGQPIRNDRQDKILKQIALDCDSTVTQVWNVYTEMLEAVLNDGA